MRRRWIVRVVVTGLVVTSVTRPVSAFLGFGDIVFDPSVYAEAVEQIVRLEQQYAQLVQTYLMVRNQYQQMLWMAQRVPVNMSARYRALATPWRNSSATNTYGTTDAWTTGINWGLDVPTGYAGATERLNDYGAALGEIPADQLERVKTNYATVELTDGANLSAMATIGRLRAGIPMVDDTLAHLEDDSFSADPAMNTEVAVLNKINAAGLVSARTAQDTNKLLVALAEQQIIDAKRTRDAEAQAINNHIRFVREGRAVMAAQAAGASDAMLAWRMR